MHMQKHIHLAEVEEKETGLPCFQIAPRLFKDLLVVQFAVGIDAGWNSTLLHAVENRARSGNAARCIEVPLLYPVEPRKNSGTDTTLKSRTEPQQPPTH